MQLILYSLLLTKFPPIQHNHIVLFLHQIFKPMKLDLLFFSQNSEKMMWAGGYYLLFIFIYAIKDLKTYKS